LKSLAGEIDLILDGGPTTGGIESTVLDITTDPPRLLRPGLITVQMLEAVIGPISLGIAPSAAPLRSPGLMERHYAPRTPMELATDGGRKRVKELVVNNRRVGWLTWPNEPGAPITMRIDLPRDPVRYAAGLYAALHSLDAANLDRIVVALPPDEPAWLAVRDRLMRAGRPVKAGLAE
jgi:L-threonylcarbamoyladenylate synthase